MTAMAGMTEQQKRTRDGYDGVVELYASLFGGRLEEQPFSRGMVSTFAELVRKSGNARVADVGCGPGHVTGLLGEMGLEAVGFDLSPGMVEYARRAEAGPRFEVARMEALPVADGAFGGVVAHYSVIHTPPPELPGLLAEQVRVLAPGGLFLVSLCRSSPSRGRATRCRSNTRWHLPTVGPWSGWRRCWWRQGWRRSRGWCTIRPPNGAFSTPICWPAALDSRWFSRS